ncbi:MULTISPECIES: ABC transporter ATP-binding protein [unclassified Cryobacterium]|uniref:ABC transporter ATP-binding protein n=1 Tax=unclassified Cryobacterium TaxID=2649013 RepID=UPI0014483474|nr:MULTISPECIES: ABC transporter ATP-binding protein [unclassified Cryobacterium]
MEHSALALRIDGLTVRRGRNVAVRDLDLSLARGELVGLLGPSGSGKTTLMRSIVGVQRLESGTVTVLGQSAGSPPLRHRVGYVTQDVSVYSDLTVRENLSYFATVLGVGGAEIDRVVAATDLGGQLKQLAGSLSGGQVSRVSLAAALLGTPELLVLDEPTVGLDPVLRSELWGLFRELARGGVTLLVSSHVMDEATRCDRLLLMRDGEILADTTPRQLLADTGTSDAEEAFLVLIERHPGERTEERS